MNRRFLTTAVVVLMLAAMAVISASCEHAFPNDDLDFYWRLESIEYKGGVTEQVENTMFGFSRHIVLIEILSGSPFERHGITTDTGDSLKFDFSMYPDKTVVMDGLRRCGIDSTVTTFGVEYPKGGLILSNDRVVLHLRKW